MTHPLKKYREEHGLTQAKLASLLGVSDATVTHIENGRRRVTPERAIDWEEKTGIPKSYLCPIFAAAIKPKKAGASGTALKEAA